MLSECMAVCSHVAPQGNSSGAVMRFLSRLSPNASGQYLRNMMSETGNVTMMTDSIIRSCVLYVNVEKCNITILHNSMTGI